MTQIFIAIIILIIIYIVITINKFIKLNNKVKEAFSTMDVYLKKRWDLIPNLVEIVKGYANYEKQTLEEIAQLRASTYDNLSNENKLKSNEGLNKNITKIMALVEVYPELKANENFKDLSKQLTKVEEDIANSRKYYNAIVRNFNNKVEMFPSNILAKLLKYKTYRMFEADRNEKENIKINYTKEA